MDFLGESIRIRTESDPNAEKVSAGQIHPEDLGKVQKLVRTHPLPKTYPDFRALVWETVNLVSENEGPIRSFRGQGRDLTFLDASGQPVPVTLIYVREGP